MHSSGGTYVYYGITDNWSTVLGLGNVVKAYGNWLETQIKKDVI